MVHLRVRIFLLSLKLYLKVIVHNKLSIEVQGYVSDLNG